MRLKDKVCIITGASSGMGLEAAKRFATEGAKVVRTDIKEGPDVPGALFVKADVSKEADCRSLVETAVKKFGGLDVLYNNAGIFPPDDHSVTDTEENRASNHVDRLYEIDDDGTEHLLENEGGEDLRELYGWTLPDVDFGEPGDETTTTEDRTIAGERFSCEIGRTPLPSIGPEASIELSDCPALVWTHGPGVLRDGERVLWSVEVVELGTP